MSILHKFKVIPTLFSFSKCMRLSPKRCTSLSTQNVRIIRHDENDILHKSLFSLSSYETLTANSIRDEFCNSNPSINENSLLSNFVHLTLKNVKTNWDIEKGLSESACDELCSNLDNFKDEHLILLLYALSRWPPTYSSRSRNYKKLWNALDIKCVERMRNWDIVRIFVVNDLWFLLHLSRISKFNSAVINHLADSVNSLSKEQLVLLCFYLNVQRICGDRLAYAIQHAVAKFFSEMSMFELSVVAMAFFKTQKKMQFDVLKPIIDKMLFALSELNNNTIVSLAKCLRYSYGKRLEDTVIKLLDASCSRVLHWDHLASVHVALTTTTGAIAHPKYCDAAATTMLNKLNNLRLKDFDRFLLCLSMLHKKSYNMDLFMKKTISELSLDTRKAEIYQHPNSFISCLLYLSYADLYPRELLCMALDPKFLDVVKRRTKYCWQVDILKLVGCIRIDRPDYHECHLSDDDFADLRKEANIANMDRNSYAYDFLMDVKENLTNLLGSQFLIAKTVLEHFHQTDILLLKKNGKLAPVPPISENYALPPADNQQWIYVYVGGRSQYASNSRTPLGFMVAKLRQLKKMNFQIIEIPWFEYKPLNNSKKRDYLISRLSEKGCDI